MNDFGFGAMFNTLTWLAFIGGGALVAVALALFGVSGWWLLVPIAAGIVLKLILLKD